MTPNEARFGCLVDKMRSRRWLYTPWVVTWEGPASRGLGPASVSWRRVLDDVAGMLGEVQAGGVATISVLHPCPVVVARKKVAGLTKVNKQPYTIKRMRDNKKNERSILYIPAIIFFFLLKS